MSRETLYRDITVGVVATVAGGILLYILVSVIE
jgi:hypothetical protein